MLKIILFFISLTISLILNPIIPINGQLSPSLTKCFNTIDEISLFNNNLRFLVTATAYTPSKSECDDDPFITASGRRVRHGIIAVSRDLHKILPFGSKVKINNKIYIVDDLMHKRWRKRIDFFVWSKEKAKSFGKKKVIMEVIERGKI